VSECVLFIDDNRYEMAPLVDRLRFAGYEVAFFRRPADASWWLDQGNRPDVLICDLMMLTEPDQTAEQARYAGVTFCKERSRLLKEIECPILVLTGVLDRAVREEASKIALTVLEKPVTPLFLVDEVRRVLSSRSK